MGNQPGTQLHGLAGGPGDVSQLQIIPSPHDGDIYPFQHIQCNCCGRLMTDEHFFVCKTCSDDKIELNDFHDCCNLCGPCILKHQQSHMILQYWGGRCYGMVSDLKGLEAAGPNELEEQCEENAAIQRQAVSLRHSSPQKQARPSHDAMGSPLANSSETHDGSIHSKHNPVTSRDDQMVGFRSPPWMKGPTSPLGQHTRAKTNFGLRSPRVSEAFPGPVTPKPLSRVEVADTPQRLLRRESRQTLQKLCQKPMPQASSRSLEVSSRSLSSGVSTYSREQTFLSDSDVPLSEIAVATIRSVDATAAADNMQKIVDNFRASISSPVSASGENSLFGGGIPACSSVHDRRPSILQGRQQTVREPAQLLTKSWQPASEGASPALLRARSQPEFLVGSRGVELLSQRRAVPRRLPAHSTMHGAAPVRPMSVSPRINPLTHPAPTPLHSASQYQPRCTTITSVVSPPHVTGGSRRSLGASVCTAGVDRSRCFSSGIQLVNTPGFIAAAPSHPWATKV